MQQIVLSVILAVICFSVSAQFPYIVFPGGVTANAYADTFLNTKAVLLNAKIKSYSFEIRGLQKDFNSKTIFLNKEGNIRQAKFCTYKSDSSYGFCISDTILYDTQARISEVWMFDVNGKFAATKFEHINEKEEKQTHLFMKPVADTSFSFIHFNEKKQVIRLAFKGKNSDTVYTKLYYNKEGLLDSVKDDFTSTDVILIKRSVKGNKKIIEAKIPTATFKWIYNEMGQCIESKYTLTRNSATGPLTSIVTYYYNPDGTLSKVTMPNITANTRKTRLITAYYTYWK